MTAKNSKTQVFRGTTYTEALLKAKKEFGSEFSIVKRRDVREANLFSKLTSGKLGGDNLAVELEVAPSSPEPKAKEPPPLTGAAHPLLRSYTKALEGAEKHDPAVKKAMTAAATPFVSVGETSSGIAGKLAEFQKVLDQNRKENASLRDELRMLFTLQAKGGVPSVSPALLDAYSRLSKADVSDEMGREIVEELERECPGVNNPEETERRLLFSLARRFPMAGPLLPSESGPTVIAVIGASGVGKSTSISKLAIQYFMNEQKSVGVINEDLRRPGADSQINNLGRLFPISVSSASEPEEVRDALRSMSGKDLILLDTGGRSPLDKKGIDRLAQIIDVVGATETHLVLSGVSSEKTMRETVNRYRPTGFNRIIVSKLDECISFGSLLNVCSEVAVGLSYLTTGPTYTKPMEPADGMMLAELVLGLRGIEVESDGLEGNIE